MKRFLKEGLQSGILAVLAGDLLYLYFIGAWSDTNKWIEKTEVFLLLVIFIVDVNRFCFTCWDFVAGLRRELKRKNAKTN